MDEPAEQIETRDHHLLLHRRLLLHRWHIIVILRDVATPSLSSAPPPKEWYHLRISLGRPRAAACFAHALSAPDLPPAPHAPSTDLHPAPTDRCSLLHTVVGPLVPLPLACLCVRHLPWRACAPPPRCQWREERKSER